MVFVLMDCVHGRGGECQKKNMRMYVCVCVFSYDINYIYKHIFIGKLDQSFAGTIMEKTVEICFNFQFK